MQETNILSLSHNIFYPSSKKTPEFLSRFYFVPYNIY